MFRLGSSVKNGTICFSKVMGKANKMTLNMTIIVHDLNFYIQDTFVTNHTFKRIHTTNLELLQKEPNTIKQNNPIKKYQIPATVVTQKITLESP